MDRGKWGSWLAVPVLACALAALLVPSRVLGGTTGKLAGRVTDSQKQPIVGANVVIPAMRMGIATDADGRYTLLNIPPGKIDVKFSSIGHRTSIVREVEISSDNTYRLDQVLADTTFAVKEVVVTATAPVVKTNLTSSVVSIGSDRIKALPVQDLQDVVNLQAGVVDGHFRGGRLGEVQFQVDGVSVNNPYDNSSTLRLDRSLLQEVQVISGTFDAEYGQAMSGVVNAVLKRGTDKFRFNGEVYTGGFVYAGADRLVDFKLRADGAQNFQASLSGPVGLPETYFLVNARRAIANDYLYGRRVFLPTDKSNFETKVLHPTGDSAEVPLGYSREWSGVAKLTNRSLENTEINYQAIWNVVDGRRTSYAFKLNPDGASAQRTRSVSHGLDATHTVGKATVYKMVARQNYFDYRDMAYDDLYDAHYDSAGPLISEPGYDPNAVLQGVDFTRFVQKTKTWVLNASVTSQVSQVQQIKFGSDVQLPRIEFGTPGFLSFSTKGGTQQLIRHVNEPPDFPPVSVYKPLEVSAYGQDDLEWSDIHVRAGLRLDYFDARSTIPSDLQNPADSIQGAPRSHPQATTAKWAISPRLGVSYPISDRAALFFSYGHFTQNPSLGNVFGNADYSILARLQAGDQATRFGVMGNPDIKPEKSVQYQFGYKHSISDDLGLDVSMFYKDIRDWLGVEFISTYTQAEYARFTNVDFGNVMGFTVALTRRQVGLFSGTLDYTFQMAQGNSSDPRETATRAAAGEDPRPRQVPLNWDQRHTLNLTASLSEPGKFNVSAIVKVGGGQPYTPANSIGFGSGLETNSGRKPASALVDLRAEKNLKAGDLAITVFSRVFNAMDTRFVNGFVFGNSGSPDYSRYPSADRAQLADPTRFYGPRRIELGMTVSAP